MADEDPKLYIIEPRHVYERCLAVVAKRAADGIVFVMLGPGFTVAVHASQLKPVTMEQIEAGEVRPKAPEEQLKSWRDGTRCRCTRRMDDAD